MEAEDASSTVSVVSNMVDGDLPYLPADLIMDKIIQSLPTIAAIRVSSLSKLSWDQGVFTSKSVLNFEESDDYEHEKFINFLGGYLKFCLKQEQEDSFLNTLRLHMKTYVCGDGVIITEWLERAFQRGVKALDICLGGCTDEPKFSGVPMYYLPWATSFANAKYLTSVDLGHLVIEDICSSNQTDDDEPLLPSLKTLSFRRVWFPEDSVPSLLRGCPSLENLSFTACAFADDYVFIQSCASLKSLEFKYCIPSYGLIVDEVENLECLTYISLPPPRSWSGLLHLQLSSNMKNIYIDSVEYLEILDIRVYHALEATIITQNLQYFFFHGYLTANVSTLEACHQANIHLDREQFLINYRFGPPHYSALLRFLGKFKVCEEIFLKFPFRFKALIMPQAYRKTVPPPLPKCRCFVVMMPNPLPKGRDYLDLMESLGWIAPSANIAIWPLKDAHVIEDH